MKNQDFWLKIWKNSKTCYIKGIFGSTASNFDFLTKVSDFGLKNCKKLQNFEKKVTNFIFGRNRQFGTKNQLYWYCWIHLDSRSSNYSLTNEQNDKLTKLTTRGHFYVGKTDFWTHYSTVRGIVIARVAISNRKSC